MATVLTTANLYFSICVSSLQFLSSFQPKYCICKNWWICVKLIFYLVFFPDARTCSYEATRCLLDTLYLQSCNIRLVWNSLHTVRAKLVTCYSPFLHCQVENIKKTNRLFPRYPVLEESVWIILLYTLIKWLQVSVLGKISIL